MQMYLGVDAAIAAKLAAGTGLHEAVGVEPDAARHQIAGGRQDRHVAWSRHVVAAVANPRAQHVERNVAACNLLELGPLLS